MLSDFHLLKPQTTQTKAFRPVSSSVTLAAFVSIFFSIHNNITIFDRLRVFSPTEMTRFTMSENVKLHFNSENSPISRQVSYVTLSSLALLSPTSAVQFIFIQFIFRFDGGDFNNAAPPELRSTSSRFVSSGRKLNNLPLAQYTVFHNLSAKCIFVCSIFFARNVLCGSFSNRHQSEETPTHERTHTK